jgi:hypothetical protein
VKRDDVFEQLEPPPFGLERLRARMAEQGASRGRRVMVAAVAISAVLVLVAWPRPDAMDLVARARQTSAVALVGGASSDEVEALEGTAVAPVVSSDPGVTIYRVAGVP